jgi:hypothetical protein
MREVDPPQPRCERVQLGGPGCLLPLSRRLEEQWTPQNKNQDTVVDPIQIREGKIENFEKFLVYRYIFNYEQCCGSGMFIPDPNFFQLGTRVKKFPDPGSASKNLSILTQKLVSKLSEI